MSRTRGLVLFDADCGFCTRCAGWLTRWGFAVDVEPLQARDDDALAELGVDEDRAYIEMPYVAADGRVSYGHHAWAQVLRAGPGPAPLVGAVLGSAPMRRPGAWAYRQISTHRHRLPGGTGACRID